jgi:hypothetical protein
MPKFEELFKEDINRSMVNKSWLYLEDVLAPEFGWDLPVYFLQYCADRKIGFPLGILSYELVGAEKIVDINYVIEHLNLFLRNKISYASLLLSFSADATGNTSIDKEMLFWQPLGTAMLIIETDDTKISRKLNPGDMVYVPANCKYEIVPVTARTTVAFYLEGDKEYETVSNTTA